MPKVVVNSSQGLIQQTGAAPVASAVGVGIGAQSVTATGSTISNCTQISATGGGLVLVSGADNTKAVRLPALSDVPAGTMFFILNLVGNKTLEIFPSSGDQIHPASDNAAITIAADAMLICVADSSGTLWASAEPAATGA